MFMCLDLPLQNFSSIDDVKVASLHPFQLLCDPHPFPPSPSFSSYTHPHPTQFVMLLHLSHSLIPLSSKAHQDHLHWWQYFPDRVISVLVCSSLPSLPPSTSVGSFSFPLPIRIISKSRFIKEGFVAVSFSLSLSLCSFSTIRQPLSARIYFPEIQDSPSFHNKSDKNRLNHLSVSQTSTVTVRVTDLWQMRRIKEKRVWNRRKILSLLRQGNFRFQQEWETFWRQGKRQDSKKTKRREIQSSSYTCNNLQLQPPAFPLSKMFFS